MAEVPVYHLNLNTNYQLITKPKVGGVEVPIAIFSFEDPQHGWRHYSLAPEAAIKIQDALNKSWSPLPSDLPDEGDTEAARLFSWLRFILREANNYKGLSPQNGAAATLARNIHQYADRAISGDDPPEGFA